MNNYDVTERVVLVGRSKYVADFKYIFEDRINIVSEVVIDKLEELRTRFLFSSVNDKTFVICDNPNNGWAFALEQYLRSGLKRRLQYFLNAPLDKYKVVYAEELFDSLDDELRIDYWAKGRPICIWGSDKSQHLYDKGIIGDVYIAENDRDFELFQQCGIAKEKIKKTEQLPTEQSFFHILSMNDYDRGICIMDDCGLKRQKDYLDADYFLKCSYSEMFRKTVYADSYEQCNCDTPFHQLYTSTDLNAFPCCPSGINHRYLNPKRLFFFETEEIWNSLWFKLLRLSVINKTYCFCDWHFCPLLHQNAAKTTTRLKNYTENHHPLTIQYEFDYTCNLHCPSCRDHILVASPYRNRLCEMLTDDIVNSGVLSKIQWLRLAGMGDVFASRYYQKILYSEEHKKNIFILTNANLLTEEKFLPIPKLYERVDIYVSIDAASAETYNQVRPGGNWNTLMNNLEMLSEHKRKGEIHDFIISFVAQQANYREIPAFIAMGKRLGVSWIYFNCIRRWGHMSDEEFNQKSILNLDNTIKDEVKPYVYCDEYNSSSEGFIIYDFLH